MSTLRVLPRTQPEAAGIASAAVEAFVHAVERAGVELHSVMLVRHGQVVAEGWWHPYGPELRHQLYSLSKSFTSTALGFAVQEGWLTLDARVVDHFPAETAAVLAQHDATSRANLEAMRLWDLLTMTTGHDVDSTGAVVADAEGNWARGFLAQPVPHRPGTHFLYDSGATYMAGRILQQLTGQRLLTYLNPRLLAPLGIRGATWERCPRGFDTGGWGLNLRTEDIARFGQFLLQQGSWQGRQLLDPAWIAAATACQIPNGPSDNPDWAQGYGFQFWQCRHGAYRGDGAFGQFCVVMPQQDAVLAMTAGTPTMQRVLDLVWEHLLPAMQPAPLPADPDAAARLARCLAALRIPPQPGAVTSPLAAQITGRTYRMADNDQGIRRIMLEFVDDQAQLTVQAGRARHRFAVGQGAWILGKSRYDLRPWQAARRVAASGAWVAADTYRVRLCFYETPYTPTLTLRFAGDTLTFDHCDNAAFTPLQRAAVRGRAV